MVKAVRLQDIKYNPKELSRFWRNYFASLSLDLSRLFTRCLMNSATVRYLHRDVITLKEYMSTTHGSSVIQPFKVLPDNEIGFVYLTGELSNLLIQSMLGGTNSQENNVHYLTSFDEKLLANIMNEMIILVKRSMQQSNSQISIEFMKTVHLDMMEVSFMGESLISVQQFLLIWGNQTHVFDLGFSNKFLEGQALL